MQNPTHSKRGGIIFPVFLMTLGLAWLLHVWNLDPRVHWVPVVGMPVLALVALYLSGIDKVTAVLVPLLLITTVFAVLRQTEQISIEVELPCLLIVAGFLMLVSHLAPLPAPRWLNEAPRRAK